MLNKRFFIGIFLITQLYSLWGMQTVNYTHSGEDQDGNQLYMITIYEKEFFHKFTATLIEKINTNNSLSTFIEQAIELHKKEDCECKSINNMNE